MFDRILRALARMVLVNEQRIQELWERRQELQGRLNQSATEEMDEDINPVDYLSGAILGHERLLTIMAQMPVAEGLATTDDFVEQLRVLPWPKEAPNHPDCRTGYHVTFAKFLPDMRRHG